MAKKRFSSYYDDYYPPSKPLEAEGGIKARAPGSSRTHAWWSLRWIEHMEDLMDAGRLRRGRSYARRGQVISLEEKPGGLAARVQGSRPTPYKVTFTVSPLSSAQWEMAIDAMAEQAIFAAQLLAGEMPKQIEETFAASSVSLFPTKPGDLVTDCTCPDFYNPCKHIAAVHYILADRFDEDPFMLFRLRGRNQEQVMQALRQRRTGGLPAEEDEREAPENVFPLDQLLDHFWDMAAKLEPFSVTIRAPQIEAPLLRRLGDPAFFPGLSLQNMLIPVYQAITRAALTSAFAEEDEPNSEVPT
jgi:uncharacterized Zn finger protein